MTIVEDQTNGNEEEELGIYEDKGSGTDLSDSETLKDKVISNNSSYIISALKQFYLCSWTRSFILVFKELCACTFRTIS